MARTMISAVAVADLTEDLTTAVGEGCSHYSSCLLFLIWLFLSSMICASVQISPARLVS